MISMRNYLFITLLSLFMTQHINCHSQEQKRLFPDGFLKETITEQESDDFSGREVGGKSVQRKSNVSTPMITYYNPTTEYYNNDKIIIVCPGGGYGILAYDMEGVEICKMLSKNGYNAVLLKYRVPRREGEAKHKAPLQDLQRAISIIRYENEGAKIGVMGFSAGAHLAVMSCCNERSYTPFEDCDTLKCSPDFCALIYPAYLSGENFQLADDVTITKDTPETFIVQAQDDKDYIDSSLYYYNALKEHNIPSTLHIYNSGGHGFGLRKTNEVVNSWDQRFIEWISSL